MAQFFPRDVIHWGEEHLHPLRAFAIRSLEPAVVTGMIFRLYRALILSTASGLGFVVGFAFGVLFLCGMLTWHLGNFPVKRWPVRLLAFLVIEVVAEMATSSALLAMRHERYGSRVAEWSDWWPMAFQTLTERGVGLVLFTVVLAASVQVVRRRLDRPGENKKV